MIEEELIDEIIIGRYIAGDKSALQILVKRWHKIFCKKAYWVLRDKALSKDVAQECWIIIIDKLYTLKKTENFKSWALRIVYNKSIDAHKRCVKEMQESKKIECLENSTSVDNENDVLLKQKLLTAIQDLPSNKQVILRLFYVEEYSIKEISSLLNIPIGTVKSRLFKAREKLKSILKS